VVNYYSKNTTHANFCTFPHKFLHMLRFYHFFKVSNRDILSLLPRLRAACGTALLGFLPGLRRAWELSGRFSACFSRQPPCG